MKTDIRETDTGLFGPDSVTWRVHADPSMAVAGVRALLQQALHPIAMAGVAGHSNFREDAWGRLTRTAEYVGVITYGTTQEAKNASKRVREVHKRLKLDDPHLLRWVHVSMVDSFLDVARRSGMALSDADADTYVSEMQEFAKQVGIKRDIPSSRSEMATYLTEISPELMASDEAREGARFIAIPPMPDWVRYATPAQGAWAGMSLLAAQSLPNWASKLYGFPTIPSLLTDGALRAFRLALMAIPGSVREGPHIKAAKERLASGIPLNVDPVNVDHVNVEPVNEYPVKAESVNIKN